MEIGAWKKYCVRVFQRLFVQVIGKLEGLRVCSNLDPDYNRKNSSECSPAKKRLLSSRKPAWLMIKNI